ncbi:serine/threonine protein kinase [Coemansia sp. RSA 990]|nr:serine/threonine protein kinase [Coemansia sp. RSA 1086]KAJ1747187.1 serine/threonine protein kinase [Coemansia sp. RSA 1821]KAJ1870820.1 serine/threonine protein kinase [Coemansia sp. RSA 990]
MGIISGLERKVENSHFLHHQNHHHNQQQQDAGSKPSDPQKQPPEMPVAASEKTESLPSALPKHIRHSSLKIRTDSANHDAALPPQPKTAGVGNPPSPFADSRQNRSPATSTHGSVSFQQPKAPVSSGGGTPKPPAASSASPAPIGIKRTTSFSQRLHNLLHRDKSQKHPSATPAAVGGTGVQGRNNGGQGNETPTIAYRTPTQSTDISANVSGSASTANSPPSGISPHASSANMAKDAVLHSASSAYHAQRGFEPVPEDRVFAVSNVSLRSVQRHGTQIKQSIDSCAPAASAHAAEDLVQPLRHATINSSSGTSAHSVSREPSQNTLHQNQSAADIHAPTAGSQAPAPHHPAGADQGLGGKTLLTKPTAADVARNRQELAAGTTRDLQPPSPSDTNSHSPCPKKMTPVYSTHKAKLNQFGRQTKVIGKGTGGTVHLLRCAELENRPPSLRSGPPSSHHADEPTTYSPSEHKLFAVKEFRKRRPDETPRAYMKKVTSEFCIGSSIHQENVIETLDLIFEGERVYEIMEYCPHDLFSFVSRGTMDLDETFCWFKQLCQGVQYLHKIGIAHRDLKLENCLLTENGIVKIIDFGCATVFKTPFQKEPSKVVGVCGSDPYIAPEVLMSRRQVPYYAQVADIWSVGIMYMCMTLLKFPWRIADTEVDRSYGSYIREWPRGRDKLFAQLPKLRHDGEDVIKGMVYPDIKGRLTMDQVMESKWMQEIDACRSSYMAHTHHHNMKID